MLSRRRFIELGGAAAALVVLGGGAAYELVENGILPGKYRLEVLLGGCDVPATNYLLRKLGPELYGSFYSRYRRRTVGYTIAYPPNHKPPDSLPLIIALHGYSGSHLDTLYGGSPGKALALRYGDKVLPPMALVTVDGGGGYWTPHPDDDPFGMLIHELIPFCRGRNLGRPEQGIGMFGISMGGYGALLVAEKRPDLVRAAAAVSPAIWTSYAQARGVNPGAYASAQAFAENDVVTHAASLTHVPVRVAIGEDDPFFPGVEALRPHLPSGATVITSQGCHTGPFFTEQLFPSMEFLSRYLG